MESDFPNELGGAFRGMENNANPWNMDNSERANWAADVDVEIVDPSDPFQHEYLYWVGCAGSFDDKNQNDPNKWSLEITHVGGIISVSNTHQPLPTKA